MEEIVDRKMLTIHPDLVTFCENEKVPFVTFGDWTSITQTCKDIAAGNITLKEAARGRI